MSRAVRFAPLVVLALVAAALVWRLASPADTSVHSTLRNKPMPVFDLAPVLSGKPGLATSDLKDGNPHLVNIFASWCLPCAAEVKVLQKLAQTGVPVEGIAIRDRPEDLAAFLARNGDPYRRIGGDAQSQVQIALGSAGVPETFVVDGKGVIRYQHIGAVEAGDVARIMGELEKAR